MEIAERLKRVKFFRVRPDISSLSENERKALGHCVKAAQILNAVYLRQISPEMTKMGDITAMGIELLQRLQDEDSRDRLATYTYFVDFAGGPWDPLSDYEPFIKGVGPRPVGVGVYPSDLTKAEWEKFLAKVPFEERERLESPYTAIERWAKDLAPVEYSHAYADLLGEVSAHLFAAAQMLPEQSLLQRFLEARAYSFLSNRFFPSDFAWVDTDGFPFEATLGPYETYQDQLAGIKAFFMAYLGIPDAKATEELSRFKSAASEFDEMLAQKYGYPPKKVAMPMVVANDIFRAGEAGFGIQFVAYNLPNDRRIHALKGSKKVFSKTMMGAKFEALASPIAARVLPARIAERYSVEGRLLFVLGHEISHGVGPTKTSSGLDINTALGSLHNTIEEAKADVLGLTLLSFFAEKGLVSEEDLSVILAGQLASYVSRWRTGYTEAHAAGTLMEYNWLKNNGAVSYDPKRGTFEVAEERLLSAYQSLADEFIHLQMEGNFGTVKAFVKEWTKVQPEIPHLSARFADLPVEVFPFYDLSELGF